MIIIVIITKEEYIYRGLNTNVSRSSTAYEEANIETIITSSSFFVFLLLEFFAILLGVSVKFCKISAFQVLLHIWGVVFTVFLIVDRFHYRNILYINICFGLIPFLLEIFALILYCIYRKILSRYIQKPGLRTNLTKEEIERRKRKEKAKLKKMRGVKMDDEIEQIREKRRQEGRDDYYDDRDGHRPLESWEDDQGIPLGRSQDDRYPRSGEDGYGPSADYKSGYDDRIEDSYGRSRDEPLSRSRGEPFSNSINDPYYRSGDDPYSRSREEINDRSRGSNLRDSRGSPLRDDRRSRLEGPSGVDLD